MPDFSPLYGIGAVLLGVCGLWLGFKPVAAQQEPRNEPDHPDDLHGEPDAAPPVGALGKMVLAIGRAVLLFLSVCLILGGIALSCS